VNRFLYFIPIVLILTGCFATLKPSKINSSNRDKIELQVEKIDKAFDEEKRNTQKRESQTAIYAAGVSYSLSQIADPSVEVETAFKLNDRIISIVGAPDLLESERIKKIVSLLNSEIESEKKRGQKLLLEKDLEIVSLQKEKEKIKQNYESQIDKLLSDARKVAKSADASDTTLASMSGAMGLNAVLWGLKTFFMTSLKWVIGFSVLFLILRVLSATNPIAAAVFSIFNVIASSVIGLFKFLTPKAFELCGFASARTANLTKDTLKYIVNEIQELKNKQKDNPDKKYELNDILSRINGEMNQENKDLIEQILKEEKWKK